MLEPILCDSHPLLDVACFVTDFPAPLVDLTTPPELLALLAVDAPARLTRSEEVRAAVRDLLRFGGYRPTGRGKPASEYLVRAVGEGALTSINLAVDACNAVSLHSGLPISVVDAALLQGPARIRLGIEGEHYVFNTAGQEIEVTGLLCLADVAGPCANGVKDAQRTKTGPATVRTLSVVWGTHALAGRTRQTESWYRELLEGAGARTASVLCTAP